jgi:predicted Zn-dependent protease
MSAVVRPLLPLLLVTALLAGCASSSGRTTSWPYPEEPRIPQPSPKLPPEPIPGVPSPIPPPLPVPAPDKPLASYPHSADKISNPAVLSLLAQARDQRASGNAEQAAAALERAVRIEPRNYFVWSQLAQVHLDQGAFDQAETVAQRSNSLARGNPYVEVDNWKTIAAARGHRGDNAGAAEAQARVDDLQRILAGG